MNRAAAVRLKGLLGMRVSATLLTPKLMHRPHNSVQIIFITVVTAEAAALQVNKPALQLTEHASTPSAQQQASFILQHAPQSFATLSRAAVDPHHAEQV